MLRVQNYLKYLALLCRLGDWQSGFVSIGSVGGKHVGALAEGPVWRNGAEIFFAKVAVFKGSYKFLPSGPKGFLYV